MVNAFLMRLMRDDKGASAIEYGLLIALVAIGLVAALDSLSGSFISTIGFAANSMN